MNFFLDWFLTSRKNKKTLEAIQQHREIVKATDSAVERMTAALDGEVGWPTCDYWTRKQKQKECMEECLNGTVQNSTPGHSGA